MTVEPDYKGFARWILEDGFVDLDGASIQDAAVKFGVTKKVPYDPDVHGDNEYDVRPGDDWYVFNAGKVEAETTGWQPIATAPKDQEFLVWHIDRIRQVQLYNGPLSNSDMVIDQVAGRMWASATWRPIPEPPRQ